MQYLRPVLLAHPQGVSSQTLSAMFRDIAS